MRANDNKHNLPENYTDKNNKPQYYIDSFANTQVENKMAIEHASAIPVFNALKDASDSYGGITISERAIAQTIGLSRRTVSSAIKYLTSNGYLYAFKVNGRVCCYVFNTNLFWHCCKKQHVWIKNQIKFPTMTVLTKQDNRRFFLEHLKLRKIAQRNHVNTRKVIKEYGHKQKELQAKYIHTDTFSSALRKYIKKQLYIKLLSLRLSKKRFCVAKCLINTIPIGETIKISNKYVASHMKHVGYTTVAQTIAYLKNAGVIFHRRMYMSFNSNLIHVIVHHFHAIHAKHVTVTGNINRPDHYKLKN